MERVVVSFWGNAGKVVSKVGKFVFDEGVSAVERSKKYKEDMQVESDDALFLIIRKERNSSPLKAGAAMQELVGRGYSKEEVSNRIAS